MEREPTRWEWATLGGQYQSAGNQSSECGWRELFNVRGRRNTQLALFCADLSRSCFAVISVECCRLGPIRCLRQLHFQHAHQSGGCSTILCSPGTVGQAAARPWVRSNSVADSHKPTNVSSARFSRLPRQCRMPQRRCNLRRPKGRATNEPSSSSFCAIHGASTLTPRPSFTSSLVASMLPTSMTALSTISSRRKYSSTNLKVTLVLL